MISMLFNSFASYLMCLSLTQKHGASSFHFTPKNKYITKLTLTLTLEPPCDHAMSHLWDVVGFSYWWGGGWSQGVTSPLISRLWWPHRIKKKTTTTYRWFCTVGRSNSLVFLVIVQNCNFPLTSGRSHDAIMKTMFVCSLFSGGLTLNSKKRVQSLIYSNSDRDSQWNVSLQPHFKITCFYMFNL